METFYKLEKIDNVLHAVFRIPTSGNDVFMRVSRTFAENENRFVVEVDSQRFLSLWRNTRDENHKKIARGTIADWYKDERFNDAKAGFSKGENDPVPLAEVSIFTIDKKTAGISISCGVTRTIYLLSQKATMFPVECGDIKEARLIQQFAGLENGRFKSVAELIPQ